MATSDNDRNQQNRQQGSQQGGQQGGSQQSGSQQGGSQQGGQRGQGGDTSNRGFASMDPDKQREIASEGGRAAHEKGTAHEFTSEEARRAGSQSHKNDGNRQSAASDTGMRDAGNAQTGQGGGKQGQPGGAGSGGSKR